MKNICSAFGTLLYTIVTIRGAGNKKKGNGDCLPETRKTRKRVVSFADEKSNGDVKHQVPNGLISEKDKKRPFSD